MIRVRFHGRGGHGVKTAGRILGTAAFLAGREVQDSPVYGAERRGAAVVAYARIDETPILERGTIERPDVIVLADETLLRDPAAGVLRGQETCAALFVNSTDPAALVAEFGIRARVVADDLAGRTVAALGRASALSAGLGAAAARLVGLPRGRLEEAVREELAALDVEGETLERNVELARSVFDALTPVDLPPVPAAAADRVAPLEYVGPILGAPSVLAPGNAEARLTGAWRVERPVVDADACTRCGLCFVRCPDGAISLDEHGFPVIDYDHCKGCMICREVCPIQGIRTERETRAW